MLSSNIILVKSWGIKMIDTNNKAHEIKRLTTPLTLKDSKAYDDEGKLLKCSETLSDVRFVVEPTPGILNDNEILQYAPQSKAACEIRLKRGVGKISDVLFLHESIPWIFAFYYVVLLSLSIIVVFGGNKLLMFILLILFILPLVYIYLTFNVNRYPKKEIKQAKKAQKNIKQEVKTSVIQDTGLDSLKRYEKDINNLKTLFDIKEGVVRDLIKKRFEPPQITYDKFISIIDSSHKLFYNQADSALNIINLAVEDTPRVEKEIENKIEAMKKIINQIEELTNELVININDDHTTEEVNNLIDDMENLIGSVKEY